MQGNVLRLQDDEFSIEVTPVGGAVLSAAWNDIAFLQPSQTPALASQTYGREASFPLVPFGNRIENNRFIFNGDTFELLRNSQDEYVIHGDGWLKNWTVTEYSSLRAVMELRQEKCAETPFDYLAAQSFSIEAGRFRMAMMVTNRGAQKMPFGLGFHPYFPRTPAMTMRWKAQSVWTERDGYLPGEPIQIPAALDFSTGNTLPLVWFNHAYEGWDGTARIEWPEQGLALSISADETANVVVLYSPNADADFVCFEPMTHLPNALCEARAPYPQILEPGQTMHCEMDIRPTFLR